MRAVIILLLLLVACRREDVPQSVRQPPRVVTTTSTAPPADLKGKIVEFEAPLRPAVITECRTGNALDANGLVATKQTKFTSQEKIHTSIWLKESPAKLVMSVRALRGDDEVAQVNKPANLANTMTITLGPLKPGKYKLETYWGGNVVCEQEIEVTSPSRPD